MSDPFVGEIKPVGFNFAPTGWLLCDGTLQLITAFPDLFLALGTTYGGDGATTFALPDLQGRVPLGMGPNNALADKNGVEAASLTLAQVPSHTHQPAVFNGVGDSASPAGHVWAASSLNQYDATSPDQTVGAIGGGGSNQPHNNMQPFLTINFIISTYAATPHEPFIAEIRLFAFNSVPTGWAACNGQLLPISPNIALFALLGATYGGNGTTNFALPDLRGRVPLHFGPGIAGNSVVMGEVLGEEAVTLQANQMAPHSHTPQGSDNTANSGTPDSTKTWANSVTNPYSSAAPNAQMAPGTLLPAGGGGSHENRQPYLALNPCIALQGIFPPH